DLVLDAVDVGGAAGGYAANCRRAAQLDRASKCVPAKLAASRECAADCKFGNSGPAGVVSAGKMDIRWEAKTVRRVSDLAAAEAADADAVRAASSRRDYLATSGVSFAAGDLWNCQRFFL